MNPNEDTVTTCAGTYENAAPDAICTLCNRPRGEHRGAADASGEGVIAVTGTGTATPEGVKP